MARRTDPRPATVPFAATPAGQPMSLEEWVNRHVWTDRMLDALRKGVRGGKWHSLHDKVYNRSNLIAASYSVLGNQGAAGVDHQTVENFQERYVEEIDSLMEDLRMGKYQPHAVKRVWIPKPGSTEQRPLGIPIPARRDGIAWCKRRCCTYWNRFSTSRSPSTVTVSARAVAAIMLWSESRSC